MRGGKRLLRVIYVVWRQVFFSRMSALESIPIVNRGAIYSPVKGAWGQKAFKGYLDSVLAGSNSQKSGRY